MEKRIKEYNYCLDFIKGIACFFVVCMHCEFPGKAGMVVQCMTRFCVPFFFMVSGYYCFYENKNDKKSVMNKTKHIAKIIAGAAAVNVVFAIFKGIVGITEYSVSVKDILRWVFFNKPVILLSPTWFLFALLYVYLLYMLVEKFSLYKMAYVLIPILFLVYVFLAQGLHLLGINVPNYYYKNFLIEGFPFFMLGHYFHYKKEQINVKNSVLFGVFICTTILCIVERNLCGRDFGVNICSIPQVAALFLIGIKNPKWGEGIVQIIGKKYSMFVYVLHPVIWGGMDIIIKYSGIKLSTPVLYILPFVTFFCSLIGGVLYIQLVQQLKKKR